MLCALSLCTLNSTITIKAACLGAISAPLATVFRSSLWGIELAFLALKEHVPGRLVYWLRARRVYFSFDDALGFLPNDFGRDSGPLLRCKLQG